MTNNKENVSVSEKKNRKKYALIFIAVALIIGILSGVLLYLIDRADQSKNSDLTNMYSDELHSYIFYKPDYDLDVTTVAEYMELDRMLYYKEGSEEFGITDDAEDYGEAVVFFEKYFKSVIAGDWEAYNEMFTENYFETNEPKIRFAPQMIYDMHISKLWERSETGRTVYAFDVSYRIYRNNGTFRNDIDSGAAKTLYFELVEINGEVKIDRITYYV